MKTEPLKNKTQSHGHKKDKSDRHDVHDDTDIKSATEWLKSEMRGNPDWNDKSDVDFVCMLIDKAFEDVTK